MYWTIAAAVIGLAFACTVQAKPDEREKAELLYETTLNLIELLVEQGVIKKEVADEMIRKAEQKAKIARQQQPDQANEKSMPSSLGTTASQASGKTEPALPGNGAKKGEVRVMYVPEHVKKEIRDELRAEVVANASQGGWKEVSVAPEWTNRFKMEGDIRLRAQQDFYADSNAPAANFQAIGQAIDNTTEDQLRGRLRMRLGINANVTQGIDMGMRLATGNINGPVSTGQLLGDPFLTGGSPTSTLQTLGTYASKFSFVLDQAYLKLTRWDWFTASGGRFPNPYFVGTVGPIYSGIVRTPPHTIPMAGVVHTDLLWDVDLNFEGVALNIHPWIRENRTVKPFFNAGIYPLQQINQSETVKAKDKWFYGVQAGMEWAPEDSDMKVRFGAAYYDFRNIAGVRNPNFGDTLYNQSAPLFRQKGNSLFNIDNDGDPTTNLWALAADYRIANATLVADYIKFKPIHVIGTLDYVRNVGYNENKVFERTGQMIAPEVTAFQVRLTVGYPVISERHQWQVFGFYRYSQRDSMLDAFTDSNYLLGGTNHKGYTLHGLYGLAHNTWLGVRYNSYREISGLPLAIDSVNVDLNARF